jgi:hypothetical protein
MQNYRLGLRRDKKGDPAGAMEAYSAAISFENVPDDVKAMALYNRAILFAAKGEREKAATDLNAIMEMSAPVRGVTDAARRRLDRLQRRQEAAESSQSERKRTP